MGKIPVQRKRQCYALHGNRARHAGETLGCVSHSNSARVRMASAREVPHISERVYDLPMVPARQQTAAIEARAAGHAGGLDKARNDECGCLLPCPKGCPAKAASAALQILAGPPARLRFAPCIRRLCGATGTMERS
jgi:hypothetical protein